MSIPVTVLILTAHPVILLAALLLLADVLLAEAASRVGLPILAPAHSPWLYRPGGG